MNKTANVQRFLMASVVLCVLAVPAMAQQEVSGTITISGDASDSGSGMNRVEFYVDGNLIGTDSNTSDSSFSVQWDTNSVPNGAHTLVARAFDNAGNQAEDSVSTQTNNQDTVPPTIQLQIIINNP